MISWTVIVLVALALSPSAWAGLESCVVRAKDTIEWNTVTSQYQVQREGVVIGFVAGEDEQPVPWSEKVPWADALYVDDGKGRLVLSDSPYRIVTFTDVVGATLDRVVSAARHDARLMGCWDAGGYTPDLCCANGGWDSCWAGPFSYETCCSGWHTSKQPDFLEATRLAFDEASVVMMETAPTVSPFYKHALLLASMVQAFPQERLGSAKVMVEVGVDEGAFAVHIMQELVRRGVKVERYYAVDPWTGPYAYAGDRSRNAFLTATRALAQFWPAPRVLQERGDLACRLVEDETADFVFVDAVHDYGHVTTHLEIWWPKLRKGGVMAGHDYSLKKPGLQVGPVGAAQAFATRMGLSLYLLGLPSSSFVMFKPL